ncbi:hypothetical protein V2J09_018799 [Rumex salicifolius]
MWLANAPHMSDILCASFNKREYHWMVDLLIKIPQFGLCLISQHRLPVSHGLVGLDLGIIASQVNELFCSYTSRVL